MSAISPGSPAELPGKIEAIGAGSRRSRYVFAMKPQWIGMLPISPGAKLLWEALEGHVNESGHGHRWCYPNQDDISNLTCMSERSIRRHTQELLNVGLVETKVTWDPAANKKKTFYLVNNEPAPGFEGPLSYVEYYAAKKNASSETNRPNWPLGTGQIGRLVPAKLADELDQVNEIKGTRKPLNPGSRGCEETLPGFEGTSLVAAVKAEKVKTGSEEESFRTFYENAYPRKVDRKMAYKAWKRAVKAGADPSMLIEAARKYAGWAKRNPQIGIKYPATWLNGDCWENTLVDERRPDQTHGVVKAHAEKCPEHLGQPLNACGPCISERKAGTRS